ncbi:MAG: metallophosphoesterase family protein [Verrucomicrobiota bacterium]
MRQLFLYISILIGSSVNQAHEHPYEFRHWEKASPDPDRIILTWSGDPATTQSVTWRTDTSVRKGFAEIAVADPSARFDLEAKRIRAKSEDLDLSEHDKNARISTRYHSATFEALSPNTLYAYRVGDGKERWSEWIQFRTASDREDALEFLYFGDAQNAVLSHWSRIIRAAYKKAPDVDFAIHAGDLINRAHKDQEWAEWFKAGGWIHASLSSIVVPGNHEYDELTEQEEQKRLSIQWRPQFELPIYRGLPKDLWETVYYLDIQGVRVVALDSNREIEAQAKWLDRVLSDNDNHWTVLTFHHPMFSSGKGRNNDDKRAVWKPILDKHKVDLVLQGHDHTYARGHTPVRMTDGSGAKEVQTMYVNSVSGPKMYEFQENGWNIFKPEGVLLDRKAENTQFFQVIRIEGNSLVYKAYMANGALYDAFEMTKSEIGEKTMRDWSGDLEEERSFENTIPYTREGF